MADVVSIDSAREHLRVGSSVSDDALAPQILAAENRIENFLGRSLVGADGWATAEDVPAIVAHAVKLALSDFYVNREAPQLTDDQLRPIIGRYMLVSFG